MNRKCFNLTVLTAGLFFIGIYAKAAENANLDTLDKYNVVWNTLGTSSADSMPLGNGDVGVNVWTEQDGDLLFYIGKNDAWSDNAAGAMGLIKVGRVRVSLDPSPFAGARDFSQSLLLRDGSVVIRADDSGQTSQMRLWVDANRPVIHVEAECAKPVKMRVSMESWRKVKTNELNADTIFNGQANRIVWCYRNQNRDQPQLRDRTIGAAIEGDGLVSVDAEKLVSTLKNKHHVAVHTLTSQPPTTEQWLVQLDRQITAAKSVSFDQALREHQDWWKRFWNRSWIFVTTGQAGKSKTRNANEGFALTTGYLLQRFKQACSSRGEFPIKFNGSIFNVEGPNPWAAKGTDPNDKGKWITADFRCWGGMYWFQNTRAMYWPMLMSGDFDLMLPLFRMYRAQLDGNMKQVREFYGHGGAYIAETKSFWGGLDKVTAEQPGDYTRHYYTPILELSAMMLDYFAYTGDESFARQTLLPMADAGVTFYAEHFPRGADGTLRIEPSNSVETYWKVRDPLPDIAGLRCVLQRLIGLPPALADEAQRKRWTTLLDQIPAIPVGVRKGKKQLLPFPDGQKSKACNSENPELYAIYPFRLYGVGMPDLDVAQATFAARRVKASGCWYQDPVQAALIGDVQTARKDVFKNLTNKDARSWFPAFWSMGFDYIPDEDNGGNGLNALQLMLMQCDRDTIRLLPAWPDDWNADFKLHAPYQTTVEGRVTNGKIVELKVTPEARRHSVTMKGE